MSVHSIAGRLSRTIAGGSRGLSGKVRIVPNQPSLVELDHFEDARPQLPDVDADGELIAAVGGFRDRARVRGCALGLGLKLGINLVAKLKAELEIWRRLNGTTLTFHTQLCYGIVGYTEVLGIRKGTDLIPVRNYFIRARGAIRSGLPGPGSTRGKPLSLP